MKKKKTKRTVSARADSLQGRVRPVTEERILQVCNDIAENMNMETHSKRELWECVRYWMAENNKLNSNRVIQLMNIASVALRSANANDRPEPDGPNAKLSSGEPT